MELMLTALLGYVIGYGLPFGVTAIGDATGWYEPFSRRWVAVLALGVIAGTVMAVVIGSVLA